MLTVQTIKGRRRLGITYYKQKVNGTVLTKTFFLI